MVLDTKIWGKLQNITLTSMEVAILVVDATGGSISRYPDSYQTPKYLQFVIQV